MPQLAPSLFLAKREQQSGDNSAQNRRKQLNGRSRPPIQAAVLTQKPASSPFLVSCISASGFKLPRTWEAAGYGKGLSIFWRRHGLGGRGGQRSAGLVTYRDMHWGVPFLRIAAIPNGRDNGSFLGPCLGCRRTMLGASHVCCFHWATGRAVGILRSNCRRISR